MLVKRLPVEEFAKGVELSGKLSWIADGRESMTRAALKWILEHEAISCVIPGFKNVKQVEDNLGALDVPGFIAEELTRLQEFYVNEVHANIRGAY